jgi:amino acid transporter
MSDTLSVKKFGTSPVFFTAISTILGAILFLRFGYAVGTLGFKGVIGIILLGHLVTIPTALAISELATNKRVEGGGEYFIISRSFGLNIGATIGMALYMSQAISVAFYVIAFTEAFYFFFDYMKDVWNITIPRQVVSIPVMLLLSLLILKKGANMGVKALYYVVAILGVVLVLFFLGQTDYAEAKNLTLDATRFKNKDEFFMVFAIIFPAFTGMTAGVGLSGDLKNPSKSIPLGTTIATIVGMIIYVFIAWKLVSSASTSDLINDQFVMGKIALGGLIIIPIGLAASTISSALGSVMVAPRTLQALAGDRSFPSKGMNKWLAASRQKDGEPANASLVTCIIALVFVMMGDVNAVAEIISMFFMVTYGSLCLISFLNHFGSSPSYRPSFRSHWVVSLIGFITSVWVMFKINMPYALASITLMVLIYLGINYYNKDRKGLVSIFANSIFQLNRNLQIFLQKHRGNKAYSEWRPSAICISDASFERDNAYRLLEWLSYKYGFGTYLHRIKGFYSKENYELSKHQLAKLISSVELKDNHVYLDTIISPSYTSAIAQAIQTPGIAGMENNMVIFEYDKNSPEGLKDITDNFSLVNAGHFDICILASSTKKPNYKNGIHVWIQPNDEDNANLMILLSFIILRHPDWKKGNIKIFTICKPEEESETRMQMQDLVKSGRLPITAANIEIIPRDESIPTRELVKQKSSDSALTLIGFHADALKHDKEKLFDGYDGMGDLLFVHAHDQKIIE